VRLAVLRKLLRVDGGRVHRRTTAEPLTTSSFARRITVAGELFQQDPSGGEAIPNWSRVLTASPDFPQQLREAVRADAAYGRVRIWHML
jgi:hypothetical protein